MTIESKRVDVGTSGNPISPYHGEQAIRAAVELWRREGDGEGRAYPRKPDDVSTTLIALRLYCEREGLDFAALVTGVTA